jgi:hypothetical protein
MQDSRVQITFPTHTVHVAISNGRIRVFKYNGQGCDWALFDSEYDASDYIVEPLPTVYYRVCINEEE